MTAAKIMDIISRLPGCDGQAADAVSAKTQVKMKDAHKLLKIQKSECPDHLDSSTTTPTELIWIYLLISRVSRTSQWIRETELKYAKDQGFCTTLRYVVFR